MKLVIITEVGSMQRNFEEKAVAFGINPGMFAISADGKKYLNPRVQWLWGIYRRAN